MNAKDTRWFVHYEELDRISKGEALPNPDAPRRTYVNNSGSFEGNLLDDLQDLGYGLIKALDNTWGHPGRYGVFKDDGTVVVPFIYSNSEINFIPDKGLLVCENNRHNLNKIYGLNGELVVFDGDNPVHLPAIYDDAHSIFSENLLAVHRYWCILTNDSIEEEWHNGWGFVDKKGNEVIPCNKDYYQVGDFHEGMAWVKRASSFMDLGKCVGCYIDNTGSLVCRLEDCYYLDNFSEGLAIVGCHNNTGLHYIDKKGSPRIGAGFWKATPFKGGLAKIQYYHSSIKNREYIVDINGRLQLQSDDKDVWVKADLFRFNVFHDYQEGFSVIGNCNRYHHRFGMMDITGEIVIPVEYSTLSDFKDGKSLFVYELYSYRLPWCRSPFKTKDVDVDADADSNPSSWILIEGYYDVELKHHTRDGVVLPRGTLFSLHLNSSFYAVFNGEKYGVYDLRKKVFIIPCLYDELDFNGDAFWVKKDRIESYYSKDGVVLDTPSETNYSSISVNRSLTS